jgi:hypothetical protein
VNRTSDRSEIRAFGDKDYPVHAGDAFVLGDQSGVQGSRSSSGAEVSFRRRAAA